MPKSFSLTVVGAICYVILVAPAFHTSGWEWNQDPVDFMRSDQVAVCVTASGVTGAMPLSFQVDEVETIGLFQPSRRGQCAVLSADDATRVTLLPQRQHMFLQTASVTWVDGRSSELPQPRRPGGWRLE